MRLLDDMIGLAIKVYRRTPLYPRCGAALGRWLLKLQQLRSSDTRLRTRDLGRFSMKLDLSYVVDTQIYYSGAFEPATVETLRQFLRSGGVALDVGANIGYITLVLRDCVGPEGKVVSFEPLTQNYVRLRDNIALNRYENVTAVHAGLGDRAGRMSVSLHPACRLDGRSLPPENVAIVTLDDYLAEYPIERLDLMKVDTDGAEEHVLRGAAKTLAAFRPVIVMELGIAVAADEDYPSARIIALLESYGYRVFDETGLKPHADLPDTLRKLAPGTAINIVARPEPAAC